MSDSLQPHGLKTSMPSVGEDMEQLEFSYITSGTVTLHNDFRKEFFSFFGFSEKQMPR